MSMRSGVPIDCADAAVVDSIANPTATRKASSTPIVDTTHIHTIICHHGMMRPVTSM